MPWSSWRAHFERNALRPLPAPPRDCDGIPQPWRAPLLRSLARFQVGEAGEGRIARQIDRVALPGVDDDYRVALKLFVREEGRHARILGDIIRAMGGSLLRGHWTEQAFVGARRLAGVRAKLLVLLAAEVVGIAFYGAVATALPACDVRDRLAELCADEAMHLQFHVEFFRSQTPTLARRLAFASAWSLVGASASALVIADHRETLRALEITPRAVARALLAQVHGVTRAVVERPPARAFPRHGSSAILDGRAQ